MSVTQVLLPTDVQKASNHVQKSVKKQTQSKEKEKEERTGGNPMPKNPLIYQLMTADERKQVPATIAAQYSADAVVDNKEQRNDTLKQVNYYMVPSGYGNKFRQPEQNAILAKLKKPVNYSKESQLKEQVRINMNDVHFTSLNDIDFSQRDNVINIKTLDTDVINNNTDTQAMRFKRREFVLPTRSNQQLYKKLATRKNATRMKGQRMPPTEIIRQSNKAYRDVKNYFNPEKIS